MPFTSRKIPSLVVVVVGVGGGPIFFNHQGLSKRAIRTTLEKQLDPMGPIASRGVSLPVFLKKPVATCDFPGGGGSRPSIPSL